MCEGVGIGCESVCECVGDVSVCEDVQGGYDVRVCVCECVGGCECVCEGVQGGYVRRKCVRVCVLGVRAVLPLPRVSC